MTFEHAPSDPERRRFLRLAAMGASTAPLLAGCATQAWFGEPALEASVVLGERLDHPVLDSSYAGLSYEKAKLATPFFSRNNRRLVGLCRELGPSLLRVGGNSVDLTRWNGTASGGVVGLVSPPDQLRLGQFLDEANWRVLYGLNFGSDSAEMAAEEAQSAATILGDRLIGFEIGNEPDLFRYNGLRPASYDFAQFLTEWRRYRDAIVKVVPGALFSGPSSAGNPDDFTLPLVRAEGPALNLVGQHYYRANGEDPMSTVDLMLSGDPALGPTLAALDAAVRRARIPGGFRYTEANSFYHGGARNVSNTFASALWAIDFLFRTATGGARGVNFHGGGHTSVYTPIADDDEVVLGPRAEYYGLRLFALAARGHLLATSIRAGGANFAAYAVEATEREGPDGHGPVRVVLINKERRRAVQTELRWERPARTLSVVALTAPQLESTADFLLGGRSIGPEGQWQPPSREPLPLGPGLSTVIAVPAASALLVTLS